MDVIKIGNKAVFEAVKVLKKGGIVVFPTDTVYGFLADASNKKAVEKIYKIKKRVRLKPLPVFVKDIKMAKSLAVIDKNQEKILNQKWPGKYTFVLKAKKGTIALRVPNYKPLNILLKKINRPLAQTSVNISGQPALNKFKDIIKLFETQKTKPDLISNAGSLPKRKASAIIDLTKDKIKIIRK